MAEISPLRRRMLRQEGIGLTDRRTAFEAAVREAIGDDRLLEADRLRRL